MSCEYYKPDEIAEKIGVNTETLRLWWQSGQFPKPISFGSRCHRWLRKDLDRYFEQLRSESQLEEVQ